MKDFPPNNKEEQINKKYGEFITEFEHLKLVGIINFEFRNEASQEFEICGLDFFTNENEKEHSWDAVLYSKKEYSNNELYPIFIEVKGKGTSASSIKDDLKPKIDRTEEILSNSQEREEFFNQPGFSLNVKNVKYHEKAAEYVVFCNESDFRSHFIDPQAGLTNALPFNIVWWVLTSQGVGSQTITFPYGNSNGIPVWRNCRNGGFCKHNSKELNNWLEGKGGVRYEQLPLPCKTGTMSKGLKIAIILSTFEVFPTYQTKLTRDILLKKIQWQFYYWGCKDQKSYAEMVLDEMIRLKVIKNIENNGTELYQIAGKKIFKMLRDLGKNLIGLDEDLFYFMAKNSLNSGVLDGKQPNLDKFFS